MSSIHHNVGSHNTHESEHSNHGSSELSCCDDKNSFYESTNNRNSVHERDPNENSWDGSDCSEEHSHGSADSADNSADCGQEGANRVNGSADCGKENTARQSSSCDDTYQKSSDEDDSDDDVGSHPPHVSHMISSILNCRHHPYEAKLTSAIVNPATITETWADIQIDESIKKLLIRMANRSTKDSGAWSYGVLKDRVLGGVLLYGPPGTGKTQLARVLAKETRATMISVSAADLESSLVGESEKLIQALFHLAKILAPSIIFIDECDGLFRCRSGHEAEHARSRKNQLLVEADGLSQQSGLQPLLLLATNFPTELDHALLRRTPTKIYLGMPSQDQRRAIFASLLKGEEVLDKEIVLDLLASSTDTYSGSDIKSICIQAALEAESDFDSAGGSNPEAPRCLTVEHFEHSLDLISPSISPSAIDGIQKFAREFNPPALTKMRDIRASRSTKSRPLKRKPANASPISSPRDIKRVNRITLPGIETLLNYEAPGLNKVHGGGNEPGNNASTPPPVPEAGLNREERPTVTNSESPGADSSYKALDSSNSEIRLLEFVSGGLGIGETRCILRTVSLNNCPPFTALSYVWGDPSDREDIILDGRSTSVTKNLAVALRWVKYHWTKQYPSHGTLNFHLWADAICINQNDLKERTHQVQLMRAIYSQADMVISSVSSGNPTIECAFNTYKRVHELLRTMTLSEIHEGRWVATLASLDSTDKIADNDETADALKQQAQVLGAFCRLPYWTRIWIVQEVVLAKSVLIICDGFSIDLELIFTVADILRQLPQHPQEEFPGLDLDRMQLSGIYLELKNPNRFLSACRAAKATPALGLDLLCDAMTQFRATDPRDYVYGVLGMLPFDLDVDYNRSVGEIYSDFTHLCIKTSITLPCGHETRFRLSKLFQFAGVHHNDPAELKSGFPSWVPRFDKAMPSKDGGWFVRRESLKLNALEAVQGPSIIYPKLLISGCRLLKVRRATSPSEKDISSQLDFLWRLFDHIREYLFQNNLYVTGIPPLQAILRAILLNSNELDSRTASNLLAAFLTITGGFQCQTQNRWFRAFDPHFQPSFDLDDREQTIEWFLKKVLGSGSHFLDRDYWSQVRFYNATLGRARQAAQYPLSQSLIRFYPFLEFEGGYLGSSAGRTHAMDEIWILDQCDSPVVLRKVNEHYVFVGLCFVLGLSSEDELNHLLVREQIKAQQIELH